MMEPEIASPGAGPIPALVREVLEKAAYDNGFRRLREIVGSWMRFSSTTAPVEIWVTGASLTGPWRMSFTDPAVADALGLPPIATPDAPAALAWSFGDPSSLHQALDRVWNLSASLPDTPLREFEAKVRNLPSATEIERMAKQRIGQDIFRDALMRYWSGACPITGITEPELLRASHIKAWADCDDDAERLDVHNGLLLSALWDAAFDKGLVTFDDEGVAVARSDLSVQARRQLGLDQPRRLPGLTDHHRTYLRVHRARFGFEIGNELRRMTN